MFDHLREHYENRSYTDILVEDYNYVELGTAEIEFLQYLSSKNDFWASIYAQYKEKECLSPRQYEVLEKAMKK